MKSTLAKCNEDAYLPSLHLSTVELRCKLQEKLHRVTWPSDDRWSASALVGHCRADAYTLSVLISYDYKLYVVPHTVNNCIQINRIYLQ